MCGGIGSGMSLSIQIFSLQYVECCFCCKRFLDKNTKWIFKWMLSGWKTWRYRRWESPEGAEQSSWQGRLAAHSTASWCVFTETQGHSSCPRTDCGTTSVFVSSFRGGKWFSSLCWALCLCVSVEDLWGHGAMVKAFLGKNKQNRLWLLPLKKKKLGLHGWELVLCLAAYLPCLHLSPHVT